MEQLQPIPDDNEFEFNSYNNELLEDSLLYNLNGTNISYTLR